MAFNDTLFQLGMDLTRSSTAHEEDIVAGSAYVAPSDRSFTERESVRFVGSHLIVDLIGAKHLDSLRHVEGTLKRCVDAAGAKLLTMQLHHVPARGAASLDIFMSGDVDPYKCVDALRAEFAAREVVLKAHKRDKALPEHVLDMVARKATAARAKAKPAARVKRAA
jgi:S-adenosylmethionine decarboxylase